MRSIFDVLSFSKSESRDEFDDSSDDDQEETKKTPSRFAWRRSSEGDEVSSLAILQAGVCQINPVTKTGQRLYMVHMLLLPFLPIAALIIQNSTTLNNLLQYQKEVERIGAKVDAATMLEKFVTNMQRERSEVAFNIFTNGTQTLGLDLSERFAITDNALERMPWPAMAESENNRLFKSKLRFQIRHGDFRQRISQDEEDIQSILNWYNSADGVFLNHLSQDIRGTNSSAVWRYLIAYKNLLRAIENIGIAVVYGIRYYGKGSITHDNYVQFIRHDTLGFEYLEQSKNFVPQVAVKLHDVGRGKDFPTKRLKASRDDILAQKEQNPDPQEALRYYMATFNYTEDLRIVLKDLRLRIVEIVNNELNAANQQQALGIGVLVLVLVISPVIIFLVRNATVTIQIFSLSLTKKAHELKMEKKKADALTYQMLPRSIAKDLQMRKKLGDAMKFDAVTICFSDIVDFSQIVEDSSPHELVFFLNAFYRMFDYCIQKYDVFKVDTVNDSHMIASGVPDKNGDRHASIIASMSLDVMSTCSMFPIQHKPNERVQLRSSIHTGSVVAGVQVVGSKMPRYRLFGETVDVASMMNVIGEAFKIHISLESKVLLDTHGGFRTENRGVVEIKGKGTVNSFWLLGKETADREEVSRQKVYDLMEEPQYMRDLSDWTDMTDMQNP